MPEKIKSVSKHVNMIIENCGKRTYCFHEQVKLLSQYTQTICMNYAKEKMKVATLTCKGDLSLP